jgi:hypothetical protein
MKDIHGYKASKEKDGSYTFKRPEKPEITLEQVLLLIFIFCICAFNKEAMHVLDYIKNLFGG